MNTQPLYGAFFFAGFYWIPNLVWATGFYAIGLAVPTGGVGRVGARDVGIMKHEL